MLRCSLYALAACLAFVAATRASAADCYDVAKGEPRTLTGTLDYVVFPGPSNFKDVQGGDAPEPNYVLRLATPICIAGDESADPAKPFKAVQVLETDETAGQLRGLLNQRVTLRLKGPLAAQTGHHHEPLVAWVASAQLAEEHEEQPVAVEVASAASTVGAFYKALGEGQGEVAALMIAPDRRGVPAFSASGMSRFYGALREPIHVLGMNQSGPDTYLVVYRYANDSRICAGRAVVTTRALAGTYYIDSIRALDGC